MRAPFQLPNRLLELKLQILQQGYTLHEEWHVSIRTQDPGIWIFRTQSKRDVMLPQERCLGTP